MHCAALNGHEGAVKLLVSWGVDTTIKNNVRLEISQIIKHGLFIISLFSTNPRQLQDGLTARDEASRFGKVAQYNVGHSHVCCDMHIHMQILSQNDSYTFS